MNKLKIEDKIKGLEQLYILEKDQDKKLLILSQLKKYKELIDVRNKIQREFN